VSIPSHERTYVLIHIHKCVRLTNTHKYFLPWQSTQPNGGIHAFVCTHTRTHTLQHTRRYARAKIGTH